MHSKDKWVHKYLLKFSAERTLEECLASWRQLRKGAMVYDNLW